MIQQTIGKLRYEVLPERERGRRLVKLTSRFVYRLRIDGLRLTVAVPRDFISNLASVPRLLWSLFPPDGEYQEAVVAHDYLYSLPEVSRWLADAAMRHLMEATGVPLWKRMAMFYGVRLGGWACKAKAK